MRNRLIRGVSGIVAVVLVAALGACAPASGARTSAEATPENPLVLTLANNLGDDHVTSQALAEFASDVKRRSGGRIEVKIYGNGQLGDEPNVLGQLHEGIVDMTRRSEERRVGKEGRTGRARKQY